MKNTALFIAFYYSLFAYPGVSFAFVFDDWPSKQKSHSEQVKRLANWKALIVNARLDDEWSMINKVNKFFNKIHYTPDSQQWGKPDYWSTPTEFINSNAGDCEDYAIAKYYTLAAMGLNTEKMHLTHVVITPSNQAHMVLLIKEDKTDALLTLDNRNDKIIPFTMHEDLTPIYSFNSDSLWITKTKQEMTKAGKATQIKHWTKLNQRMTQEAPIPDSPD